MANRNQEKIHYGLDAELQEKLASRWNPEDAQTCLAWIAELSGETLPSDFQEALKSGVALCKAMNRLNPGSIPKINTMKQPFMMRENLVSFLNAAKAYGMRETDCFVSQDLFEGDNLCAVVDCIFVLGGLAQQKGFNGPTIGIKNNVNTDKGFKFEVKSTGDAGALTRQNIGSYGYQDKDHYQLSIGRQIIKTEDSGDRGSASKQNQGSVYFGTEKRMDSINRLDHVKDKK